LWLRGTVKVIHTRDTRHTCEALNKYTGPRLYDPQHGTLIAYQQGESENTIIYNIPVKTALNGTIAYKIDKKKWK